MIDIAAGSGGQSIEAGATSARPCSRPTSRRTSSTRRPQAARAAGVSTIATRVMDGEDLDVEPGSFDAAISRLGLMYLPDKLGALATGAARASRRGQVRRGRVRRADRNGFFSVPIAIIRRRAELPPPAPGLPGPFSSATLGDQLDAAGFRDVEVHRVEAPLRLASAAECTQLERESFGALHQMLAGLPEDERQDDLARDRDGARRVREPRTGSRGPCELLVGVGTN